jgi:hypothetical protein
MVGGDWKKYAKPYTFKPEAQLNEIRKNGAGQMILRFIYS